MVRSTWIRALVVGMACTVPAWGQVLQPDRLVTIREAGKPAQKCRVLKVWTQKDGTKLAQVQVIDTGEVMTILEESIRQGGSTPVMAKGTPAPKPRTGGLFASWRPAPGQPAPTQVATQTKPSEVAKASVSTPQPGDWRQSWGKVEPWKASESQAAVAQASARAEPVNRPKPPLARQSADDPLRKPEAYTRTPLASPTSGTGDRLRPMPTAPAGAPVMASAPAPAPRTGLWGWITGSRPVATAPVVADGSLPPGMGSVMAAHSPHLEDDGHPVGAVVRRDGKAKMVLATPGMPPVPPTSVPVGAPNAFTMTVPPAGSAVMDTGVPSHMGNAWTMAGTHRPVPADMGMVATQPQNAFQHAGMDGAAARPPVPPMMGMPPMPPQMMAMAYYPPQAHYPAQPEMMPPAQEEDLGRLMAVLRDALMPSEREMAVDRLARRDWRTEPTVVNALVTAAKADPAPLVRASCVRALGTMKANIVPVVQAVESLKGDPDPRVREAVSQALETLLTP